MMPEQAQDPGRRGDMAGEAPTSEDHYNFTTFVGDDDFLAFRTVLPVGSKAPDFAVTVATTGEPARLRDYWRDRDLVIEFGSLTCPFCAMAAPALDSMARAYADQGFASVFVYTREIHPGEQIPPHRSFAQKLAHARDFAERYQVERPVLVDDLAGTGHHLYGLLPNMIYLVSRAGRVLFRSDWTDPPTLRAALDYLIAARARRREGWRLRPFYVESVGYRWSDPPTFQEGLALAGPQAVEDFARAVERWSSGSPLKGGLTIDEP
jgi:thiol-disulfide isomerase/thioredoxin